VWQHLDDHGLVPWGVMGHSAGEFAALVAARVLDRAAGLRLVVERSRAMASAAAATPGCMVAVGGLPIDEVRAICGEVVGSIVVANENSPIQTVISGEIDAVNRACALARGRGALRLDRLAVGGAFHSPLMEPVRRHMEPLLRQSVLHSPRCTLISSISGEVVEDVDAYRELLCAQVVQPVRWLHAVRTARLHGVARFVEVGPGRVLSSLVRSCDRSVETSTVRDVPTCLAALASLATPEAHELHVLAPAAVMA